VNRKILLTLALCCLAVVAHAESENTPLRAWLEHQAAIKTWQAEVTQIRHIKNLAQPLKNEGKLWFIQPNQFRWQLGEPARTLAIRDGKQLLIVYPRLKQAERFPFDDVKDPAMKQALLLLEVGFPSNAETFFSRYELLSEQTALDEQEKPYHQFELQPRATGARKLLEKLVLEVTDESQELRATQLFFTDGSSMRNEFYKQQYNQKFDPSILSEDLTGYDISEPLKQMAK